MTIKKKGITIGSILLLFAAIILIVALNSHSALGKEQKTVSAKEKTTTEKAESKKAENTSGGALGESELSKDEKTSGLTREESKSNKSSGSLNAASGSNTNASSSNNVKSASSNTNASVSSSSGGSSSEKSKPSTSSNTSSTPPANPNSGKTWHEAITEERKIKIKDAWTEYKDIYAEHDLCVCGYNLSLNGASHRSHVTVSSDPSAHGSYKTDILVKVGTERIDHEAEWEYKTVTVREAGYY